MGLDSPRRDDPSSQATSLCFYGKRSNLGSLDVFGVCGICLDEHSSGSVYSWLSVSMVASLYSLVVLECTGCLIENVPFLDGSGLRYASSIVYV